MSETKYQDKSVENTIIDINKAKYALENQIGWQKYGEAKLIFLCTISAGSIGFLVDFVTSSANSLNFFSKLTLAIFTLTSFIALIIGIIGVSQSKIKFSFRDLVKDPRYIISWDAVYHKNLEELKNSFKDYDLKIHLEEILVQHQVGANHTRMKYRLFNLGITIYSIGVFWVTISILLKIFNGN